MDNEKQIINLLEQKNQIEKILNSMIYGSVEIREYEDKKYIYVHYREDGINLTKYAGEYSDNLYNLILKNNNESRQLKRNLKEINKRLADLNYTNPELDEKVKLNIDFAHKNLVSTIYKQAILEGVATTYADTKNIIEGGKVNNMTAEDVTKIINLKHAWDFILNENVITVPTDFNLMCEINKNILEGFYYNAGMIRSTPVNIGGTTWKPELPIEDVIRNEVKELNKLPDSIEKGIKMLLYIMKRQIFIDGNKRTAVIYANHYYISHAMGIIAIPEEMIEEYKVLLINYYEGKDIENIVKFLKEKCFTKI